MYLAPQPATRVAASMSGEELGWVADVLGALLRGAEHRELRALARRAEIAGVANKVLGMRRSLAARAGGGS